MKYLLSTVGGLALLLGMQAANASLIGTTVDVSYVNDGNSSGNAGPHSAVVQAGSGDAFQFGFNGTDGFTINIEASQIFMTCTGSFCNTNPDLGPAHYIFNGLDWGGTATLASASLDASSSCPLCDVSLNLLNSTSLDVVFANGANPGLNDTLVVNLQNSQAVPEPATLAMLALGLVGIGFSRKRHLG